MGNDIATALKEAMAYPTTVTDRKLDALWPVGGGHRSNTKIEVIGAENPSEYKLFRPMYGEDRLILTRNSEEVPPDRYKIEVIEHGWEVVYRVTLYQDFVKDLDKAMPLAKTPSGSPPHPGAAATANMAQVPASDLQKAMVETFLGGVGAMVEERIDQTTKDEIAKLEARLAELKGEIDQHKIIEIKKDGKATQIKGLKHKNFEQLLKNVTLGFPVMLVGSAGTGKTFGAKQVSDALGSAFYSISVGLQTSKSDLFGYMDAGGTYRETAFRKAYENGGLFLLDEADAGNANVLVMLNSALSGDECAFPDKMVKRHKDFYLIATANTYGTGASRMYVGRNQLDAATLDRFIVMEWEIDEKLEAALVKGLKQGTKWHTVVKRVRQKVFDAEMRVIVSPRATVKGAKLLETGLAFEDVVRAVLLPTATADQRTTLMDSAKSAWRGY